MTGMEHAIGQAAQVIAEAYRKGGDIWGDDLARASGARLFSRPRHSERNGLR